MSRSRQLSRAISIVCWASSCRSCPTGADGQLPRRYEDGKILGTLHVATGRSDHLGGHLTPDKFKVAKNATHDDILCSRTKTPEIRVPQARMFRDGKVEVLIEDYRPAAYLQRALTS